MNQQPRPVDLDAARFDSFDREEILANRHERPFRPVVERIQQLTAMRAQSIASVITGELLHAFRGERSAARFEQPFELAFAIGIFRLCDQRTNRFRVCAFQCVGSVDCDVGLHTDFVP